jgi:hypothetical protein
MKKELLQLERIKNLSNNNSYYEELLNSLHTPSTQISFLKLKNKLYSLMTSLAAYYKILHSNIVRRFA